MKLTNLSGSIICQFILFIAQVISGGWIWFDMMNGVRPPLYLLRFHPISGTILTAFILLHIYLNRAWIKMQLINLK
jgi:predicted small integral membrane protein